jgi:1-acyl-sn-glycerol-3-phosphate acyltransferase
MLYTIGKPLVSPIIKFLWLKKVEGISRIPKKGPVILAANHVSFLDPFFLIAISKRRLYFLAKNQVYVNRFIKFIMNGTGQVKVDLDTKDKSYVFKAASQILGSGNVLGIFPEGKMSKTGTTGKAYLGVAKIALENKTDIIPVAILNGHHIFPPHFKFPKFKKVGIIKILPAIKYEDFKDLTPEVIVHDLLMPKIANEVGHDYEHRFAQNS